MNGTQCTQRGQFDVDVSSAVEKAPQHRRTLCGSQVIAAAFARVARRHDQRNAERAKQAIEFIENRRKRVEAKLNKIRRWLESFGAEQIAAGEDHGHDPGARTIYRAERHRAKIDNRLLRCVAGLPEHALDVFGKNIELDVDSVAGVGVLFGVRRDPDNKAFRQSFGNLQADAVDRNRAFFDGVASKARRHFNLEAMIGAAVFETADARATVDVALNEMPAQPVAYTERALEVNAVAAAQTF